MHEISLLQAAPHADLSVLMQLAKAPVEHKAPSLLLILSHSTTPSANIHGMKSNKYMRLL